VRLRDRGPLTPTGQVALALLTAILMAMVLTGFPGCSGPLPTAALFQSEIEEPLPDSLTKWIPEGAADACPTCGPVLWQHPSGNLGLTAVETQMWTPWPPPQFGVYRPQAIQRVNANFATSVTTGFALGDSIVLPLTGLNRIEVDPFYGVSADTLDTLVVLTGTATVKVEDVEAPVESLLVHAFVDVLSPPTGPWRLETSARLVRE
jgi:hypothetical protein